ncbi:Na+/H+ antiporter subunit A [Aestuariimicrobium kwangyangense]|uniref:Na+/H+ antiporter subunit A n=1 Tax=Aestuariimicrobium kwangyangense TaxID=396389 RepID=UPI0003B56F91|nr:Na+/H+ antiporter subunit A [Aestuariimicrobium kwangyangense]
MLLVVTIFALVAVVATLASSRIGRLVFLAPALVSIASAVWFALQGPTVAHGRVVTEHLEWMPALGVSIDLRLNSVSWLLAMVVTGVGGLIFAYSAWYFDTETLASRTVGLLTGFAASMLLLVLADDLIVLTVGWELTTVFSYLLVGLNHHSATSRRAAMTALVVTTVGGLSMLTGVLLLRSVTGTTSLSQTLDLAPTGVAAGWAAALLLVGALTKSAIVPFQFWLPGAMAAPTPVSAFLHAAAMVKAGIFLVAMVTPIFVDLPWWRPVLVGLGVVTMLLGALRALRQVDIKVLLAHGTVSQLGLLLTTLGVGTPAAVQAGLALLAAHAVFKATLFMVVGSIDRHTGTRDLRRLGGLVRSLPVTAVIAIIAAASMSGIPPTFGFVAKESALAAALEAAQEPGLTSVGWVALVGIAAGAVLTFAYSLRLVVGVFFGRVRTAIDHTHGPLVAPALALTVATLVLAFTGEGLSSLLHAHVARTPGADAPHLALWHGVSVPLLISTLVLVVGVGVHRARGRGLAEPVGDDPFEQGYTLTLRALDRLAVEVTGRVQTGSLPLHIGTILVVVVALPGMALLVGGLRLGPVRWSDSLAQAAVVVLILVAAVYATLARGRLKTFMLLAITGYGTALLFLLHGAPDLALTQSLTETVFLVLLVLVLRRLPKYFTDRPLKASRYLRALVSIAVGTLAAVLAMVALQARAAPPVSESFYEEAYDFGYGHNIVNVTLVDIRAWDTLGEISVLLAAATGVASLVFVRRRASSQTLQPDTEPSGRRTWLRGAQLLDEHRASPLLEMMTRLLFPVMMLVSVYLLMVGHNLPGGGFAGALVAGIALAIRYLAGGRAELEEAVPLDPGKLLGGGMVVAVLGVVWPVLIGGRIGQSYAFEIDLGPIGVVKLVTTLVFDIGVWMLVIGAMLDFVRSLGSGIDLHSEKNVAPVPRFSSDRSVPGLTPEVER